MDTKTRRSIALDYWATVILAVGILIMNAAFEPAGEISMGAYFCAAYLLIHAHGRRILDTLKALHTKDS